MTSRNIHQENTPAYRMLRADSITGWISPEGFVHVTPLFQHLNFFAQNIDIAPDISLELLHHIDEEGNVRVTSELMATFMNRIYAEGWGRIGTFGGDRLELDCATEHLRSLRRKAKDVARITNRSLVCNVTEPGQKPKRKHKALARDEVWSSLRPGFVGWLSPDHVIFETAPHDPFGPFIANPDYIPDIAEELAEAVSEDSSRQSDDFCEEADDSDPGGHVPWHNFYVTPYCPRGDDLDHMIELVLSNGWGRLTVERPSELLLKARTDADLADGLSSIISVTGMTVVIVPAVDIARHASPM